MYVARICVVPCNRTNGTEARRALCVVHRLRQGARSVKKQTLILVLIGAILFVAGSVIAYASVRGASKNANNNAQTVASTTTSAVVAKKNIPAGTTGQAMVSNGWVAIQLVSTKSFVPTDLTSLQALNDEVLSTAVK